MHMNKNLLVWWSFVVAAALVSACANRDATRLERWSAGKWTEIPAAQFTLSGARDGARTHATAVVTMSNGRTLTVDMTLAYNPTPVLESGMWQMGDESGTVTAEAVKFLGGQGSGPSVGGRFRLEDNGQPRYRVTFPAQPVSDR